MAALNGSQVIHLPQEIVDGIVDHIALERKEDGASATASLRTCSVLSRAFSTPSRRHLFSKIHIGSSASSHERSAGLLAILKRRSSPLVFVKSLTVELQPEEDKLRTNAKNSRLYNIISSLILREKPFFGLLKLLSRANLENLTIKPSGFLDWKALNEETLSTLTLLRSNPSIKSLYVHAVKNLDNSFLVGNGTRNQLERLELWGVHFSPLQTKAIGKDFSHSSRLPFSNLAPLLTHIRNLDILPTTLTVPTPPYCGPPSSGAPEGLRQPAASSLRMNSLKRLLISYWEVQPEIEMLWQLMLSASQSLEYLEMQGVEDPGSRSTFSLPIQLHRLSTLRSLKLVTYRIARRGGGTQQLIPITRLLKTATSPSSIEMITIALSWDADSLSDGERLIDPGNGWLALDEALASRCFPSLKTLRVELELVFSDRFPKQGLKLEERAWAERIKDTHFKEMLPNISSSAWIRLDVEVDLDFVWPVLYS